MRRLLDRLYGGALMLAALALVAIAILVFIQVSGRLIDRGALALGFARPGISVPSLAEIGGFLFVGAATLALAGTFRRGGHVRVTMLVQMARGRLHRALVLLALAGAAALAAFAAWNSVLQAHDSWAFNSTSFGMVRVPLWIPQGVMALGFVIFLVALVDDLIVALRGDPSFRRAELERESGHGH